MPFRDIGEVARMALTVLWRSPVRSGLTVLGLAIGVGAFIAMTSFGMGAKTAVVAQFAELGTNLLRIQSLAGDPSAGPKPARPLTATDVAALRRDLTTGHLVAPHARNRVNVAARGVLANTFVYGTTPEYFTMHNWHVSAGGFFDDSDMTRRNKVCVLGATPATMLFGSADPLGATLTIGESFSCHVIGLLEVKGLSTSGRDLDNFLLVPLTTFEAYIGVPQGYAEIEIQASGPELMGQLRDEATAILRRTHGLAESEVIDFRATSPTEALKAAENVSTILTRLLAAIAAVSLIVGGIGIMNIQLVSVAERTREIGTRAAIGASPQQILVQFLAEALVLSSVGALVGIIAGVGGAVAVARAMHWQRAIEPLGVVGAALFGVGAGIVFGYMPARRAAQLDPIEALRHD